MVETAGAGARDDLGSATQAKCGETVNGPGGVTWRETVNGPGGVTRCCSLPAQLSWICDFSLGFQAQVVAIGGGVCACVLTSSVLRGKTIRLTLTKTEQEQRVQLKLSRAPAPENV